MDLLFFWVFFSVDLLFFCVFIFLIGQFFKRVNYLFPHYILHVCIITSQDSCTGVNYWESGWCSGYSHRLAPMHPGFNSTCIVQMVFPIHACSRRFFPGSPVSSCLQIWDVFGSIKNTPHPGEMGSCCVKKSGCYNLSADRRSCLHGSTPQWSNMIMMIHQWQRNYSALICQEQGKSAI